MACSSRVPACRVPAGRGPRSPRPGRWWGREPRVAVRNLSIYALSALVVLSVLFALRLLREHPLPEDVSPWHVMCAVMVLALTVQYGPETTVKVLTTLLDAYDTVPKPR